MTAELYSAGDLVATLDLSPEQGWPLVLHVPVPVRRCRYFLRRKCTHNYDEITDHVAYAGYILGIESASTRER